MALRVELKPGERIILGQSIVTNGDQRTRLTVEGDAPILREKDILTPASADTPAKRLYLAVQLMYLAADPAKLLADYSALARDFLLAAPSSGRILARIDNEILRGRLYKALRAARDLVAYEGDLLDHARGSGEGLRADGAEDGGSA